MDDATQRWVLGRTRIGEQWGWLTGFDENNPVWVASMDEAATYDRDGAELERRRCSDMPDYDDVLYAVCHLKTDDDTSSRDDRDASEEPRLQIAKRIS